MDRVGRFPGPYYMETNEDLECARGAVSVKLVARTKLSGRVNVTTLVSSTPRTGSLGRRFRTILLVRDVPDMSQNLSGTESYCKGTTNSKNTRHEPYNPLCSTTRVLTAVWVFPARLCPAIFAASVAFWLQNGCTSISRGCNPGAKRVHRRLRRAIPVAFWVQKGCTPCSESPCPLPYL